MFYIKYALAQQWQGQMMGPDYMYLNMIIQKGWEVTKKVRPFWLWTGVRTLFPFEYRSKWCKYLSMAFIFDTNTNMNENNKEMS
jgi:hypothetical protein